MEAVRNVDFQHDGVALNGAMWVSGAADIAKRTRALAWCRSFKGEPRASRAGRAFEEDQLAPLLRRRQITDVTITGVATEDGVPHTAPEAIGARFAVRIDSAAIAVLDEEPGDVQRALATIERPGGRVWRLSHLWPLAGVRHSAA
jgi:hypothetical protein